MGVSINTTKSLGVSMGNKITPPQSTIDPALILKYTTTTSSESIEVKTGGSGLNYDVDWGDSSSDSAVTTATKTHTYSVAGTYTVKITGVFPEPSFGTMSSTNRAKLVEMSNWGTIQYTSLHNAFEDCSNMQYSATDAPDLSTASASTSNMFREMFKNCDGITGNVDLSSWTNLTCAGANGLYFMFAGCHNMDSVNLTGWNVSNATNCQSVFNAVGTGTTNGCTFILDDMNWSSNQTFLNCIYATKINTISLDNWVLKPSGTVILQGFLRGSNTPNATLTLDLSGWTNTAQISTLYQSFHTSEFTSINITGWDTSNVTTMAYMFYQITELTEIVGLSSLKGDSVTTIEQMFNACKNLSFASHNFDSTAWGASLTNLTNLKNTFNQCSYDTPSTAPNVTNWHTDSVTTMDSTFYNAKFTTALDVSSWDFSSTTTLYRFLRGCIGTTSITFSNVSSSCTTMGQIAYAATDLVTVIFDATCNLSGVTTFTSAFSGATALTTITFDASVSFAAVTVWSNAFTGVTLNVASYDAILIRNDATNSNSPVTLGGGNSKYSCATSAAATARAALITAGWTIGDGGCI
tara:strand:+ start:537 stop:2273 length:1737 start_codon:yes stop_codon:yes gene_type:complete